MQFIISKLNLMQSSAQDLQQRYLWELSQQQKYLGNGSVIDRGSLEVSVGYLIDKEEIELSVIQAKNLHPTVSWQHLSLAGIYWKFSYNYINF